MKSPALMSAGSAKGPSMWSMSSHVGPQKLNGSSSISVSSFAAPWRGAPTGKCAAATCAASNSAPYAPSLIYNFGAAAFFDAHDHRIILSAERAARLATTVRPNRDTGSNSSSAVDHAEVVLERRRLHARIDRWEPPPTLDDVDGDRRIDDRRADALSAWT